MGLISGGSVVVNNAEGAQQLIATERDGFLRGPDRVLLRIEIQQARQEI
jgi:hypothetical protein